MGMFEIHLPYEKLAWIDKLLKELIEQNMGNE